MGIASPGSSLGLSLFFHTLEATLSKRNSTHLLLYLQIVFGLVMAIGLINPLIIVSFEDPVWAIGSVWSTAGLIRAGRSQMGKLGEEPLLAGTLIGLAGLQVACLAGTIGSKIGKFRQSRRSEAGPIRLEEDHEENP